MTLTLEISELQSIIAASQRAFLETGKYTLNRRQANEQFGSSMINTLINNKLIKDTRTKIIAKTKCRFLVTDIITAIEVFNKM